MDGEPEGTQATGARPPRWMILFAVIFAIYLLFRIAEFISWLAHRL